MNTACSPCTISPLASLNTQRTVATWASTIRAWWTRSMAPRKARLTQADLTALDGLTAETLKDIGAPEWMYERAQRAQERAYQGGLFEQDTLHWR